MKSRILVACVGIPIILVMLFLLPPVFTPVLIAVLSAVGTYEILHAIGMNHPRIALYTEIIAVLIPFWCYFGQEPIWAKVALLVYLLAVFLEGFLSGFRVKMERVGGGLFFAVLISYGLSAIVRLSLLEDVGKSFVLLPIALPFLADAVAMFAGMALGKHKLCPKLSPKKTVEGAIGSLLGGVIACVLYGVVFHLITHVGVNYYFMIVYGLVGGIISIFGDLAFSYVKRTRKIKDYGTIFPGHGGVLDRFDSVIFCAPVIELLVHWMPSLFITGSV